MCSWPGVAADLLGFRFHSKIRTNFELTRTKHGTVAFQKTIGSSKRPSDKVETQSVKIHQGNFKSRHCPKDAAKDSLASARSDSWMSACSVR